METENTDSSLDLWRTSQEHRALLESDPFIKTKIEEGILQVCTCVRDIVVIRHPGWQTGKEVIYKNTGWEDYIEKPLSYTDFDELMKDPQRRSSKENGLVAQWGEVEDVTMLQKKAA